MKKFYEKPVVEITKFAFEDIMTTSVTNQVAASVENAQAVINEIEAANVNVKAKKYFTYKW